MKKILEKVWDFLVDLAEQRAREYRRGGFKTYWY